MKKQSEKILFQGRWLGIKETVWLSSEGAEVRWESVERPRHRDAVIVFAKLLPSNRWALIRQYRPAIASYILGCPAGLVPDGSDPAEQALIELKEETGYTGVVKGLSPRLKSGAGILNENAHVAYAEVDETLPENQSPRQALEESESIEVMLVPEGRVREFLLSQAEAGCEISSGLWYAFGGPWSCLGG